MPRATASAADRQLIADAARYGAVVTARQLERWRAAGLLAPNIRRALGRGRGSASQLPPGAAELVVWLARNARPGRRPGDLALLASAAGLAVPEAAIRAAFAKAVAGIRLPVEAGMPPGSAPEDVAAAAVAAGQRFTMVPARIRRIDHALARRGVNWSFPELAALDPGRSDSLLTGSDWVYNGVQLVLSGGQGINMGMIGALARTLAPAGGVAPLAGQVEYRWPISRGEEPNGLLDDDDLLVGMLGGGDLRDQVRELAVATPAAELLDAFRLAAGLPGWAGGMCVAVEREIAAGQLGEASKEWVTSSFGLTRLLLAMTLRDQDAGPASTAVTALVLIFIRNMIGTLRKLVPVWNFAVLDNPLVAPSFLAGFLGRWPGPACRAQPRQGGQAVKDGSGTWATSAPPLGGALRAPGGPPFPRFRWFRDDGRAAAAGQPPSRNHAQAARFPARFRDITGARARAPGRSRNTGARSMDDTVARCPGPGCGRPLARAATGRPARYCGDNCRQAARRARVRAEEEAAARVARLAEARATTARLWRPLEAAGFSAVGEHAALVVSCAADLGRPRGELDQAIRGLHQAAADLAGMARDYRAAADLARQLGPGA